MIRSYFFIVAVVTTVSSSASAEVTERCHGVATHFDVAMPFASGDIPESVTTDQQGNLYISRGNQILQRSAEGALTVWATLPLPIYALGVKVGPDGCVYNASTSLSEVAGAFVWRSCQPNSIEMYAELDPAGAPNDLAFDSRGNLFVTDPVLGRVWKVDSAGTPEIFVEHALLQGDLAHPALVFRALGVNGIALDDRERFVYLSNTDSGSILRVGLHAAHPVPTIVVQSSLLRGADGVAFDRSGTLFVTVNGSDSLVSVTREREVRLLATGAPLDSPSSVAFGA
ncbi:MAG TPA: SMP-30/gluconolactonase/LRE family protein, partial [Polyangiaceae bacterium]